MLCLCLHFMWSHAASKCSLCRDKVPGQCSFMSGAEQWHSNALYSVYKCMYVRTVHIFTFITATIGFLNSFVLKSL